MRIGITCDENEEAGIGSIVDEISGPTEHHFIPDNYGGPLKEIFVVLMCRDPELKFRRRIRFAKKENVLYMDIMLNLIEMVALDSATRRKVVLERIIDEIPIVLRKYKFKGLEVDRLGSDLHKWFFEGGLENSGEEYGRYVRHLKGDFEEPETQE